MRDPACGKCPVVIQKTRNYIKGIYPRPENDARKILPNYGVLAPK